MTTIGAIIFKGGTSLENKTGSWRTFIPTMDSEKCIMCENCFIFCPDSAIIEDGNGKFKINYDYCKGCLICTEECPIGIITSSREEK